MRQVAADRGQVAHQRIGDHPRGVGQQRVAALDQRRLVERRLAGEAADRQVAVLLADVLEVGQPVDVDQRLGHGEPEAHGGDQALAAGQDLGVAAGVGEQRHGLLQRRRAVVGEGTWDQRNLLSRSEGAPSARRSTG